MTPCFEVRARPDLSLAELVEIQTAGGAVMRSAHAGNWSPANLTAAALGLRCVLTDLTLTGADTIYHPSGVVVGRRFHPGLCSPGTSLVVRTKVRRAAVPPGLGEWFPPGKNLATAHLDALRKAVPAADVTMFGDYAAGQVDLVTAILELSADHMPALWRRRTQVHAGVQDVQRGFAGETPSNRATRLASRPACWRDVVRDGVFGITDPECGWLVPKAVMCLIMAVADARARATDEVFHLAGARMMNYIGQLAPVLRELYEVTAPRLGLPARLVFNLVPSGHMTLGVPVEEKASLDRLVDVYLSARGRRGRGSRAAAIDAEVFRARTVLDWAAVSCPTPFFDVRDADYCSQYDLLVRGTDWYAHPWGLHASLGEVGKMVAAVTRLRSSPSSRPPKDLPAPSRRRMADDG